MEKLGDAGTASPIGWEAAMTEALDQTAPLRDLLTREWIHPNVNLGIAQH